MNQEQLKRMTEDKGFIAALDQSGGSTPQALKAYGVDESAYHGEEEMFTRVHEEPLCRQEPDPRGNPLREHDGPQD